MFLGHAYVRELLRTKGVHAQPQGKAILMPDPRGNLLGSPTLGTPYGK